MNDPGLDQPIDESSHKVEDERLDEQEVEKEDEQTFLNPRFEALPHVPSLDYPCMFLTTRQSLVVCLNSLSVACRMMPPI